MKLKHWIFGLFLAGFISACVTQPSSQTQKKDVERAAQKAEDAANTALSSRVLTAGQCGLFLFTRTDPARLVFFYSADAESADFHDGSKEYDVALEAAEGDLFGQFYTQMTFSTPNGQVLAVDFEIGEDMEGGARTKGGKITITDTEGWEIIQPVAGVRACQPGEAGKV